MRLLLILAIIGLMVIGCDSGGDTLPPLPTVTYPTITQPTVTVVPSPTPTITPSPTITVTPTPTQSTEPSPSLTIEPPAQSQKTIHMEYTWDYGGFEWTYEANIPQVLYDYFKELPRPPTQDYSVYVTHPEDDFYIEHLVGLFEEEAAEMGYDEYETVNFAVSFVQNLPYTSDSVTTPYDEYPRYPIETLVDNGGDCEDTSILMAAILTQMEYGVVLLSSTSHMAVGVLGGEGIYGTYWELDEGKYYYLETTDAGFQIGFAPPEYQGATLTVNRIVPVPILAHHFEGNTTGYSQLELVVTVENYGTAAANDVFVQAGFDANGDSVWNMEESEHFDLKQGNYITITFYLTLPENKHTRILVNIVHDGYSVDSSYSEWFDT